MKVFIKKTWKEYKVVLFFLLLMLCFRSALADWNEVPTGSMKPTIIEGDRVWINKLAYDIRIPFTDISLKQLSNPERGDIIVIDSEAADLTLIKRVIGLPGDTVEMINNRLIINGEPASYKIIKRDRESLLAEENVNGIKHMIKLTNKAAVPTSFSVTVPEDKYLVLGDNRNISSDYRVYGFIPREEIRGRSKLIVMSLNYDNWHIPRSDRFFKELL